MAEWFRNAIWDKEIEENFEVKLKRSRGAYNKSQYLRIQASYLLESEKFGEVGEKLMKRLFAEFPEETFSVIFGHEQLGDYYFRRGQFDKAETEYKCVIDYYHKKTRSGTTGLADIKLADLILMTGQKEKYNYAYFLITEDFEKSKGDISLNDSKYYYCLTRARLASKLGFNADSKEFARIALELSDITEPQFPRHKTVGIVKAKKEDIIELEKIVKE